MMADNRLGDTGRVSPNSETNVRLIVCGESQSRPKPRVNNRPVELRARVRARVARFRPLASAGIGREANHVGVNSTVRRAQQTGARLV